LFALDFYKYAAPTALGISLQTKLPAQISLDKPEGRF
jgi:hypothetical protein